MININLNNLDERLVKMKASRAPCRKPKYNPN